MDKLKYKFHSFEIFTDQGILSCEGWSVGAFGVREVYGFFEITHLPSGCSLNSLGKFQSGRDCHNTIEELLSLNDINWMSFENIKGNKQRLREIFSKNNSIVSVAGKKERTYEFNLNNFGWLE